MTTLLYYVHDPMCSWCWAFRPALQRFRDQLPGDLEFRSLLGGLAPDTDEPMPETMQLYLRETWAHISRQVAGTEFNFDFWKVCRPRRSTYPACRAVIAARTLDPSKEEAMILAIQRAYYLRALNPSERQTLVTLAGELELDTTDFLRQLEAPETQATLSAEIRQARMLGVDSFPGLVLDASGSRWRIPVNYKDESEMLDLITQISG